MNKKSFTVVELMLIVAIIIILLIGLIGTVQLFFPWLGKGSCIQLQRSHIDELITTIEEVLLTGEEQIVRFKVEKCTKCIWLNATDLQDLNILKLEVEYEAANETFLIPPQLAWNGIDTESKCPDPGGHLVGTKTCDVHISTVNGVGVSCPIT